MATVVSNLIKDFGSFRALKDISLTIEDGEFIAILGPSGCGKTTLLRILAGFELPTEGRVTIGDTLVSDSRWTLPPDRRDIGMIFQNFALWPHMTVKDHIRFPLQYHRYLSEEIRRNPEIRVEEVLRSTGLSSMGDRLPGQLSGGQRQRVALGRAIAPEPQLLLMDEPLSSLDAELRVEMRSEIVGLHRLTGSSIVYVSHDQEEAMAMADRIVVMRDGIIEQVGTPRDIYYRPANEFVAAFVSKANIIKGEWTMEGFIPEGSKAIWPDNDISEALKDKGLYTLRPEEVMIATEKPQSGGISGVIESSQFQGKEIHYSISTESGILRAHLPLSDSFSIGDEVQITPRI